MAHHGEHVIPPDDDDDSEQASIAFTRPRYPRITRAQWAYLVALTDQQCADALDSVVFYKKLSKETREFLEKADEDKIALMNSQLRFYANGVVIGKFVAWVGGIIGGTATVTILLVKFFGEHFSWRH